MLRCSRLAGQLFHAAEAAQSTRLSSGAPVCPVSLRSYAVPASVSGSLPPSSSAAPPMTSIARDQSTPRFRTPLDMHRDIERITNEARSHNRDCVRNYMGLIENMRRDVLAVETELFPR